MRVLFSCVAIIAVSMFVVSSASADLITEFNYNAGSSPGNASTGTGTTSGAFFPFSSSLPEQTGSPNDLNPVMIDPNDDFPNNSSAGRSGPSADPNTAGPDEVSGNRKIKWFTSTTGYRAPEITWDVLGGYRTSRYYQLSATTDGTNFSPVPTGVGSNVAGAFGSASVSADGLITVTTVDGLIDNNTGTGYIHDLSFTFPTGTAYDNNPNFGLQIAAVYDPNGTDFVSSFAGTDVTDPNSGYIRSTSLGGNQNRYDLVRISATVIPEPTAIALAVCSLAILGVRRRR